MAVGGSAEADMLHKYGYMRFCGTVCRHIYSM